MAYIEGQLNIERCGFRKSRECVDKPPFLALRTSRSKQGKEEETEKAHEKVGQSDMWSVLKR